MCSWGSGTFLSDFFSFFLVVSGGKIAKRERISIVCIGLSNFFFNQIFFFFLVVWPLRKNIPLLCVSSQNSMVNLYINFCIGSNRYEQRFRVKCKKKLQNCDFSKSCVFNIFIKNYNFILSSILVSIYIKKCLIYHILPEFEVELEEFG